MVSEQAKRIRAYADQQWLAKRDRLNRKWLEARTMFPSTLGGKAEVDAKGFLTDGTRGPTSPLGGLATPTKGRR